MFPTSGYFRGVPCPFYASGLCERPYCHFRHTRTEVERSAKSENGPSYSTSGSSSFQTSSGSLLNSTSVSYAKDTAPEQGICSTSSSVISISDSVDSELNDNLSIPSFSSTDPTLPESENEPPLNVKSLPKISGLPKVRKTLPSYVPTPKTFNTNNSLCGEDGIPSYTPTPKSVSDVCVKNSGHVIEYDPIKNFAVNDNPTGSDGEEAAFSSDEDKTGANSIRQNGDFEEKETSKVQGDISSGPAPEEDLTDSDEDVSWQASTETSGVAQESSTSYSELLTPSSFFTEKLSTFATSSKSKSNCDDSSTTLSRQHSSTGVKESSHRSGSMQATDSGKSGSKSKENASSSSHSKSTSSSAHKSSSSSSHFGKKKERHDKVKSSSSLHTSAKKSETSSSSQSGAHRDKSSSSHSLKPSSSPSSSSHRDSESNNHKKSKSSSSLSSANKHSQSSSSTNKHSQSSSTNKHSQSSSSTSKHSQSSSSSNGHSKHQSKDMKNSCIKKREDKSASSQQGPNKPHSSSSEKENKHSSNAQISSRKSHSVSRSLSSSSSSSSSKHHNDSQVEHSKSVDEKLNSYSGKSNNSHVKKPTSISNVDKKSSSLPKDRSKHEHKKPSQNPSEIINVKSEKRVKDSKGSSSNISSSTSKNRKFESVVKAESSSRSTHQRVQSKSNEPSKPCKDGNASDSDIEIIEQPPPPVYNVSDSEDDDAADANQTSDQDISVDSDTEFSLQDDVDLISDSDTFDECLRIFQESERQMAEKLKKGLNKVCPDKRKAIEEEEASEPTEDLLVSVGKKRMAHKNSEKISRKPKPAMKPRLSPAQVMHNRILEMQKRALFRIAKKEGRESDLPFAFGNKEKSTTGGISVMGGGLPLSRHNPGGTSSAPSSTRVEISPTLLPSTSQKQRQAHTPSGALFPRNKTPPRGAGTSTSNVIGKPGPFAMSPNTFYTKKTTASSEVSKVVTIAGTASKTEKRKAHEPTLSNLKRPLIPADFGSKVPTNVRQRYLNFIIDEHLKFRPELQAFAKGEEDEKSVYEKSTNKNIYLRVAVNTIKRIRTEAAQFLPSTSKKSRLNGSAGSAGGHAIQSHAATLGGPNAARQSFTLNRSKTATVPVPAKIEGKEFYNRLKTYILTEEQLRENGFPRPAEDGTSKVQFYKEEDTGESLKENERVCRRCGTRFNVTKDGEPISNGLCVYHYGSAYKKRVAGAIESRYACCSEKAGTKGCQVASCHVHERNKVDNRSGFMKTMPASATSEKNCKVYALDCEMVYTKAGLELARVTVVGEDHKVVYESLVKPDTDIIDYNTRFSGITAADMKGVRTDIRGVQAVMLSMISDQTILMGHSLESDLIALKLIHSTVVDTSLVFPHRLGLPYKRALRNLMLDHLQKIIQASDCGHDSKEDAVACMQLMMYKVKEDVKKEHRRF